MSAYGEHDDIPKMLIPSAHGELSYFSCTSGLVVVPSQRLALFWVQMTAVLAMISASLTIPRGYLPNELAPAKVWELGEATWKGHKLGASIWFGRRLWDVTFRQALEAAMQSDLIRAGVSS